MGDAVVRRAVSGLVKLALNLRLVAVLLTILWLPSASETVGTVLALLAVVAATSFVPILIWDRIGGWVMAHPSALLVDLLVAIAVLGTVGLETPFVLFVLSTALAAGALYGWVGAVGASVALILTYVGGAVAGGAPPTFADLLVIPPLVPAVAAGGAALRELLVAQRTSSLRLAEEAMSTAAASERSRLAREMHDTLAKTVHGIALTAGALPALAGRDPDAASRTAVELATTAERAAAEARELLTGLRGDDLERPLGEVLDETVRVWADRAGVQASIDVDGACGLSPTVRYELFCVVREVLRNAQAHADADVVAVTLRDGDQVRLTIVDDGAGFAVPDDLTRLARDGHFGLVGAAERAEALGGRLEVEAAPGQGTAVTVTVPRTAAGEVGEQLPPGAGSRPEVTAP